MTDKQPHIEVERDTSMRWWEINIWLEDESNYCQVFVQDDGSIVFKSKEQIEAAVRQEVTGA